jgi:hypothetical protein
MPRVIPATVTFFGAKSCVAVAQDEDGDAVGVGDTDWAGSTWLAVGAAAAREVSAPSPDRASQTTPAATINATATASARFTDTADGRAGIPEE